MTAKASDELYQFIVDRINTGIFTLNPEMQILQWNRFMEINTGRRGEEVIGKNIFDCFPELPRVWFERRIRGVIELKNFAFTSWKQRPYLFQFRHNRPITGGVEYMQQDLTFLPVKNDSGDVEAVCVTLFDATDASVLQKETEQMADRLREAMAVIERTSNEDGLTGIYNRRYLEKQLATEFNRIRRYGGNLSIVLFDLDHFKLVNDKYGHLGGDEVLRVVASRITGVLRNVDIFGRYGGEEFAVILPETDVSSAVVLAERLRQLIASVPVEFDGIQIPVTLSIGVTEFRPDMAKYEELFREADQALYRCKKSGRNCVTRFVQRANDAGDPVQSVTST